MPEYLIVNGETVPEREFYKALATVQTRDFAYNPQTELFPDQRVEEARTQLRQRFDSSEPLEVKVVKK